MKTSKFKFFKAPSAYSKYSDWQRFGVFLWDVKGGRIRQILPYEIKTSFSGINLEDFHYYNSLNNRQSFREISIEEAAKICKYFDFSALGRPDYKPDIQATIPFPTRFRFSYRNKKGELKNYQALGIIENTGTVMTCYVKNQGVKSFKLSKVLSVY